MGLWARFGVVLGLVALSAMFFGIVYQLLGFRGEIDTLRGQLVNDAAVSTLQMRMSQLEASIVVVTGIADKVKPVVQTQSQQTQPQTLPTPPTTTPQECSPDTLPYIAPHPASLNINWIHRNRPHQLLRLLVSISQITTEARICKIGVVVADVKNIPEDGSAVNRSDIMNLIAQWSALLGIEVGYVPVNITGSGFLRVILVHHALCVGQLHLGRAFLTVRKGRVKQEKWRYRREGEKLVSASDVEQQWKNLHNATPDEIDIVISMIQQEQNGTVMSLKGFALGCFLLSEGSSELPKACSVKQYGAFMLLSTAYIGNVCRVLFRLSPDYDLSVPQRSFRSSRLFILVDGLVVALFLLLFVAAVVSLASPRNCCGLLSLIVAFLLPDVGIFVSLRLIGYSTRFSGACVTLLFAVVNGITGCLWAAGYWPLT
ncbi:hypothetical protein Pelo_5336 [Pelomyxa schiedti]|nr:hypothetical protein Pelo_5336 [Pelomyxa schiedti]